MGVCYALSAEVSAHVNVAMPNLTISNLLTNIKPAIQYFSFFTTTKYVKVNKKHTKKKTE